MILSYSKIKSQTFYGTLAQRARSASWRTFKQMVMMTYVVYVLKSESTGKIYIGQTNNIDDRLKRHNSLLSNKKSSYTSKNRGTWTLIYSETCQSRQLAIQREKQLKSYQGRQFIKNLQNMGR
ncbi:MAG: GIY-YIG nuclease family protein [Patescibacteria group bacterium]|nr:GIY-YIG nuclease family protein [Patescibacteria group bacterium]